MCVTQDHGVDVRRQRIAVQGLFGAASLDLPALEQHSPAVDAQQIARTGDSAGRAEKL
jgi:hypothetical protein